MMEKFGSRKFIAFATWVVLTVTVLTFKIEDKNGILPLFSGITGLYIMGEATIDGIRKRKGE